MGNQQSMNKINFEDMQSIIKNPEIYLLINTLPEICQDCLIMNTLKPSQEESLINNYLKKNRSIIIIVYGMNTNDEKVYAKYNQLQQLGFTRIYAYLGGLFEWLMLQDIYGFEEFPTTKKQLDFLKYKPAPRLNVALLENGI